MVWHRTLLAFAVLVAQLMVGPFAGDSPERPVTAEARGKGKETSSHGKAKKTKRNGKAKHGQRNEMANKESSRSAPEDTALPTVPLVAASHGEAKAAVIVVLEPAADPQAVARTAGVTPSHVYNHVFSGFAAEIPAQALEGLRRNPRVTLISPDEEFSVPVEPVSAPADFAQIIPEGIDRIDADENPTAAIDGGGPGLDVDVAVLDSGIDPSHRDLHVVGGISCIKEPAKKSAGYVDTRGHGTQVAGIIGAVDNEIGVVGVAPGARLWAVKVSNDKAVIKTSAAICGLDWVMAHADKIDVINMSFGGPGKDGECADAPLHLAICTVVGAGVTAVASAGNDAEDASDDTPSTYEEVIAVSAFADYNGEPGGGAEPPTGPTGVTCTVDNGELDDMFASFSNFGPDVDITTPGVCVGTTTIADTYIYTTGTSFAAPHVAGAAALYIADHPNASPADVHAWLLSEGSVPQDSALGITGDPDTFPEPVLNVGSRPELGP